MGASSLTSCRFPPPEIVDAPDILAEVEAPRKPGDSSAAVGLQLVEDQSTNASLSSAEDSSDDDIAEFALGEEPPAPGADAGEAECDALSTEELTVRQHVASLLSRIDAPGMLERGDINEFAAAWCNEREVRRTFLALESDEEAALKALQTALTLRSHSRTMMLGEAPLAMDLRCIGLSANDEAIIYVGYGSQVVIWALGIDLWFAELERTLAVLEHNPLGGKQVIVVLDGHGYSPFHNTWTIGELAPIFRCHYCGVFSKVVVLDMPATASMVCQITNRLLSKRSASRFLFVNCDDGLEALEPICGGADTEVFRRLERATELNRSPEARVKGKLGASVLEEMRRCTWVGEAPLDAPRRMRSPGSDTRSFSTEDLWAMEKQRLLRLGCHEDAARMDELSLGAALDGPLAQD